MSKINIELSRVECHCLLEELKFNLRFVSKNRAAALLLWEKIASIYFEEETKMSEDFRNECLGIVKEKEEVENNTNDNTSAKKSFWDFLKSK